MLTTHRLKRMEEYLPFTKSNVLDIQKAYEIYEKNEENDIASPSNASHKLNKTEKSKKMDTMVDVFTTNYEPVFTVNDTEKTTDLKKVILTIPGGNDGSGDGDGNNKPKDPDNRNGEDVTIINL